MVELNKAYLGDCLELMNLIPDSSVDMVLCDLPYGKTNADWDVRIDEERLWDQYKRVVKENGAILLFAQYPYDKILATSNLKMYKYDWIWEKTTATGHLNSKKRPLVAHETILVFYKKQPTYIPQKTKGHARKTSKASHKLNCKVSELYGISNNYSDYDSTERFPRTVIKFPTDKQKLNIHSTQKPIALLEFFIKTYTNEGEVVLDNCAGSGSTGEACINTNRKFILMEKKISHFNNIIKRINGEFV